VYIKKQQFPNTYNKNQNFDIDSPASRGSEEKCTKHVTLSWLLLEPAMSINIIFFIKNNFSAVNDKNKGDCNQWHIIRFLKMHIFQKYVRQFSTSWRRKQILPY